MADFVSQYSGPEIDEAVGKGLLLPTITAGDAGKPVVANPDEDGFTVGNSVIPAGTSMLFHQASAPTGWTKKGDWASVAALHVGNTYVTGGTDNPRAYTPNVEVENHATHNHKGPSHAHNLQSHKHNVTVLRSGWGNQAAGNTVFLVTTGLGLIHRATGNQTFESSAPNTNVTGNSGTADTGNGGPTTHSVTESAYSPRYVQVIAATKDA
jgi:hypothetical protein